MSRTTPPQERHTPPWAIAVALVMFVVLVLIMLEGVSIFFHQDLTINTILGTFLILIAVGFGRQAFRQYTELKAHDKEARAKIEALRETHPELYVLADYLDTQGDRTFFLSAVLSIVFLVLGLLLPVLLASVQIGFSW